MARSCRRIDDNMHDEANQVMKMQTRGGTMPEYLEKHLITRRICNIRTEDLQNEQSAPRISFHEFWEIRGFCKLDASNFKC